MATATLNKTYNIVSPDINPFAGTNLDAESTNTNTSDGNYNTYKNTVYKHDDSDGWVPDDTVINGNYTNNGIRNQMDLTSNIKIFQKEGMGTSVNETQTDIHTKRTNSAVEVNPIEYTPNDNVEKGELNHGNLADSYYSDEYEGDFDINMGLVTTSANQMTYRNYKAATPPNEDKFTDMSTGIKDESSITGKKDKTTKEIDITLGGAIIEAGNHFNRGNDTTKVTEKSGEGGAKIKEGIDINSSRVLDMSMYLNNYNSDILSLRGGAGIGKNGKYSS